MGQQCASCLRGTATAAKNMQDIDLSKKYTNSGLQTIKEEESENISNDTPRVTVTFSPETKYLVFRGDLSQKLSEKANETDKSLKSYDLGITIKYSFIIGEGIYYQGEWDQNGYRTGKGIEVSNDGSKYIGFFKKNLKDGEGRLIYSNGDYYEGLFKSNKRSGQGKFVSKEGVIYEGQFKNDEQSGFGKET